jgi:hypothetical protein
MLTYKKVDLVLQLGLLFLLALFLITLQFSTDPMWALVLVWLLGGVQLISLFVHLTAKPSYKIPLLRNIYHFLVIAALFVFIWIFKFDFEVDAAIYYTVGTVLIAIYYAIVCVVELKRLKKGSTTI